MTKALIENVYDSVYHRILTNGDLNSLVQAVEDEMESKLPTDSRFTIVHEISNSLNKDASLKTYACIKVYPGNNTDRSCGVIIMFADKDQTNNKPLPEYYKWIAVGHELGHTLLHYNFDGCGAFNPGDIEVRNKTLRETTASYFAKLAVCNKKGLSISEESVIYTIQKMHNAKYVYNEDLIPT